MESDDPPVTRMRTPRPTRRRLLRAGAYTAGAVALAGVGTTVGGTIAYRSTRFGSDGPQQGTLALHVGTALLGADMRPERAATVLVRGGRILDVGPRVPVPDGAEVREMPESTLVPGLIDMHTHLGFPEMDDGDELGMLDLPALIWDHARHLPGVRRTLLEHGVTTVRSLGDELGFVTELRDAIASGELEGPRLLVAGPVLTTADGHPISTFGAAPDDDSVRLPSAPEDARTIVTELATGEHPVDLVKVIQERGDPHDPFGIHSPQTLRAIVETAHEHDLPVITHSVTTGDLGMALDAGVDGVEHLSLREDDWRPADAADHGAADWPEGFLQRMAEAGVTLDPTVHIEVEMRAERNGGMERWREQMHARLLEAQEAGVRITAGSDAAIPGVRFGEGLLAEIEALARAGLGADGSLRAATVDAAEALGSDDIGRIEAGRAADLVAVGADPLTDVSALRENRLVLREGRAVYDAAA